MSGGFARALIETLSEKHREIDSKWHCVGWKSFPATGKKRQR